MITGLHKVYETPSPLQNINGACALYDTHKTQETTEKLI